MTREEYYKWRKSLNPNFVTPSLEEQEIEELGAIEKRQSNIKNKIAQEEKDKQDSRDFVAFYNHT